MLYEVITNHIKTFIMKKTQTGWVFIITLGALSIFTLFLEQGKEVSPIVLSAFAFVLLMSYKLTVKADDEGVSFSMGIGLIRRKFKYENIEACKVIHYFPIGYGIRFRLGSTLYNVSGSYNFV